MVNTNKLLNLYRNNKNKMTCFWDGILKYLTPIMINNYLNENLTEKPDPKSLMILLKKHSVKTPDIKWNGCILTEKQLIENIEWISNLKPETINQGYDCSICDPCLLLLSHLFRVNIIHNYNGHIMKYENNKANITWNFASNYGHFW